MTALAVAYEYVTNCVDNVKKMTFIVVTTLHRQQSNPDVT